VEQQDPAVGPGSVEEQHCHQLLPLVVEAVAQTSRGELPGSFLDPMERRAVAGAVRASV
jgi:hypothetical protein